MRIFLTPHWYILCWFAPFFKTWIIFENSLEASVHRCSREKVFQKIPRKAPATDSFYSKVAGWTCANRKSPSWRFIESFAKCFCKVVFQNTCVQFPVSFTANSKYKVRNRQKFGIFSFKTILMIKLAWSKFIRKFIHFVIVFSDKAIFGTNSNY